MSSLVIAEITGKLHCNVLRDIRNTLRAHEIDPEKFADKYTTRGNHAEKCYELPRDETWRVVEKYTHRHSGDVMARWDEMEAEAKETAPEATATESSAPADLAPDVPNEDSAAAGRERKGGMSPGFAAPYGVTSEATPSPPLWEVLDRGLNAKRDREASVPAPEAQPEPADEDALSSVDQASAAQDQERKAGISSSQTAEDSLWERYGDRVFERLVREGISSELARECVVKRLWFAQQALKSEELTTEEISLVERMQLTDDENACSVFRPDAPSIPDCPPGLAIFNSSEFGDIRTVTEDGKPFFCAKDVAEALGYSNASKAIGDHCRGVTKRYTPTSSGHQELSFIPESDVYRLVMRSKLPGAERFQDWVVEEVLPTIRKTGRFEVTPAHPQDPTEALRRAVEAIQLAADLWKQQNSAPSQQLQLQTQELRAELAAKDEQLEAQKPAVAFHEKFHASGELKNIVSTAKAVGIPEKKFVAMCLDFGVLLRDSKGRLEPCVKWMRAPYHYTEYKMGRDALGVERWQPFFTPAGLEWIGGYIEKKKKQTGKYLD